MLAVLGRTVRKRIYAKLGVFGTERCDMAYRWVTDAPLTQWRTRLWCVSHSQGNYGKAYVWITRAAAQAQTSAPHNYP